MKIEKGMKIKVTRRRGSKGSVFTVVKILRDRTRAGIVDLWCTFNNSPDLHYYNNIVEDGLLSPFDDETIELMPVDKPVQRTLF